MKLEVSLTLFGILTFSTIGITGQEFKSYKGSAVIAGSIKPEQKCMNGKAMSWLSQERVLYYQAEVTPNDSFEFHVNPGKYNLVITGSTGCFVEKVIQVKADEIKKINLDFKMEKKQLTIEHSWLEVFPVAYADFGYCPYCNGQLGAPFYNYPMPSFMPPVGYPWWAGYGPMTYSNFYYPSVWANNGVNGGFYPGTGGGFFGKPNIYISGKIGTKIKIHVDMPTSSNWLSAVPAHGINGWQIILGSASPEYLFYDYRLDENKLQDIAGFCIDNKHLIPKLAEVLRAKGFQENEIKDFEEYWNIKIPPSEHYCVFPQEEKQLDEVAKLVVEPKPAKVTRIGFMIIPSEALSKTESGKFKKIPTEKWNYAGSKHVVRDLATKDELTIREWAVGFMLGKQSQ